MLVMILDSPRSCDSGVLTLISVRASEEAPTPEGIEYSTPPEEPPATNLIGDLDRESSRGSAPDDDQSALRGNNELLHDNDW